MELDAWACDRASFISSYYKFRDVKMGQNNIFKGIKGIVPFTVFSNYKERISYQKVLSVLKMKSVKLC